ncbi:MAG: NAD(+) diphosphatase [Gammaproteobacteria bacterium]|nr:NAD(+) diphosphatase [Gammaproteobacteria bacterium]
MLDREDIYYAGLKLDRASEQRKDLTWLKRQWQLESCRVLLLHNNRNLMVWDQDNNQMPFAVSHSCAEAAAILPGLETMVFLGQDGLMPIFAADVSAHTESAVLALPGEHELIDLREAGWLLSASEAALLAYARGLLYWNRHNGFCSNCGSVSETQQGGHVRRCTNTRCARLHFPRTDPAVIMLVEDISDLDNRRCLLGRNSRFPTRMMSTLAGFVDPLETLEQCVAREVFEEAGIRVDRIAYQASQPWPFPSSIMLGFRAHALTTDINIDGVEIAEADWFSPEQLKSFGEWGDAGTAYCLPRRDSIARYLIESWIKDSSIDAL